MFISWSIYIFLILLPIMSVLVLHKFWLKNFFSHNIYKEYYFLKHFGVHLNVSSYSLRISEPNIS